MLSVLRGLVGRADFHVAGRAEIESQPQVVQPGVPAQIDPRLAPDARLAPRRIDDLIDYSRGDGGGLHPPLDAIVPPVSIVDVGVGGNQVPIGSVVGDIHPGTVIVQVPGGFSLRIVGEVKNRFVLCAVAFQAERGCGERAVRPARHVVAGVRFGAPRVGVRSEIVLDRLDGFRRTGDQIPVHHVAGQRVFQAEVHAIVTLNAETRFAVARLVVGDSDAVAHFGIPAVGHVPKVEVDGREVDARDPAHRATAVAAAYTDPVRGVLEDRLQIAVGVKRIQGSRIDREEGVSEEGVLHVLRPRRQPLKRDRVAVEGDLLDELQGRAPRIRIAHGDVVTVAGYRAEGPRRVCVRSSVLAIDPVETAVSVDRVKLGAEVRHAGDVSTGPFPLELQRLVRVTQCDRGGTGHCQFHTCADPGGGRRSGENRGKDLINGGGDPRGDRGRRQTRIHQHGGISAGNPGPTAGHYTERRCTGDVDDRGYRGGAADTQAVAVALQLRQSAGARSIAHG